MIQFVDTHALVAWLNRRDADHARVKAYFAGYTGGLVTTEWVLVELADALATPPGRQSVARFLVRVRSDPQFEIIGYDPGVYQAGVDLYTRRPDKEWSLTDCISFAIMTDRGLTDALTADHHFTQAGFRAVFRP